MLLALPTLAGKMLTEPIQKTPKNVLFIAIDDLRPELPNYGAEHIIAPNIERLAEQSLTFSHAYCQIAICQPSRESIMVGLRADTTMVYDIDPNHTFRHTAPTARSLPEHFAKMGYRTQSLGKIFHQPDPASWTEGENDFYEGGENHYHLPGNDMSSFATRAPYEASDLPDEAYMDGKVAAAAVDAVQKLAEAPEPFFLAVGFWKPHLPFSAPQKYFDLYDHNDPASVPIPEGFELLPAKNGPPPQFRNAYSGELTTYAKGRPPFKEKTAATLQALADGTFTTNRQSDEDYGIITIDGMHIYPDDYSRRLAKGYYACVSFIDAQLGKVIAALEDPNNDGDTSDSIADETVIVFWGDHGFHLGHDGLWTKRTNLENSTRVPLMVYAPNMNGTGATTDAITELTDVYPSLLELAGLDAPEGQQLEGASFAPLLDQPERFHRNHAISMEHSLEGDYEHRGHTIRTDRWRYVEWRSTALDKLHLQELYDHASDPQENINLGENDAYRAVRDALQIYLAQKKVNFEEPIGTEAAPPEADAVTFFGGPAVGDTLQASFVYDDVNGSPESGSVYEWLRADSLDLSVKTVVATGKKYTVQAADAGKLIKLRVTPRSEEAPKTGKPVSSRATLEVGRGWLP